MLIKKTACKIVTYNIMTRTSGLTWLPPTQRWQSQQNRNVSISLQLWVLFSTKTNPDPSLPLSFLDHSTNHLIVYLMHTSQSSMYLSLSSFFIFSKTSLYFSTFATFTSYPLDNLHNNYFLRIVIQVKQFPLTRECVRIC